MAWRFIHKAIHACQGNLRYPKFAITGYCLGGTFALRAACALDDWTRRLHSYGGYSGEEVSAKTEVPTLSRRHSRQLDHA